MPPQARCEEAGSEAEEGREVSEDLNVSHALVERLKAKADDEAYSRKMDARAEGLQLLVPVVERMRKGGLSTVEIGRLFRFLGDEFAASDQLRPEPPK